MDEKGGAGRSRGYGFIEYVSRRAALMGLRWLNGHPVKAATGERNKRLIVEFAIGNAQVVSRRKDREANMRTQRLNRTVGKAQPVKMLEEAAGKKRQRNEALENGRRDHKTASWTRRPE